MYVLMAISHEAFTQGWLNVVPTRSLNWASDNMIIHIHLNKHGTDYLYIQTVTKRSDILYINPANELRLPYEY